MGLTSSSVGINAIDSGLVIKKQSPNDLVIAIAGNPNVGKSTLFNNLTGMNQHTGNWPGKTVSNAQGYCDGFVFVDIPGTYSLMAHSAEEEVARNFICFGNPDATVVVCDATCLERNLNLVLQTIEISKKTVVCVNLIDEAKRKHISIDLALLSKRLGVAVVGTVARDKKSTKALLSALHSIANSNAKETPLQVNYGPVIENAVAMLEQSLEKKCSGKINSRWLALRLLDADASLQREIENMLGADFFDSEIQKAVNKTKLYLENEGVTGEQFKEQIVSSLVVTAESICHDVVKIESTKYSEIDRKIDRLITSKSAGFPIMIAMLAVIFWITISGANYPSKLLWQLLYSFESVLAKLFVLLNAPNWFISVSVYGIYRVLSWVVSVMLPPMAIFFPLFTLLEDLGYLPRVAFNLDRPFKNCGACGKQALTTCMGFGCNAAGIVGCRIIDSPRERLIAMLTNNFVPCNGRFPAMLTIISVFFVTVGGIYGSFLSALVLTAVILCGILATFATSALLSKTALRGVPSSFTLELPPFRKPQVLKVIVRSIFDRTLFVLGRAVAVAAPAGAVIWIMANVTVDGTTLLSRCSEVLDPLGKLLGMDGTILMAFILGFPANEIVIPITLMAYMSNGVLTDIDNITQIRQILLANGWDWSTAVSVLIFSLMHWPCSTTILTIKKESGSIKWTALAFILPTLFGALLCFVFNAILYLLNL